MLNSQKYLSKATAIVGTIGNLLKLSYTLGATVASWMAITGSVIPWAALIAKVSEALVVLGGVVFPPATIGMFIILSAAGLSTVNAMIGKANAHAETIKTAEAGETLTALT